MASVPNMRAAPAPAPAGKAPATTKQPGGFARQLAGIPEELPRVRESILSGEGSDAATSDGTAEEAASAAQTDAPSDGAQLAALVPLLQSLPAMVPTIPASPTPAPATTPAPETRIETEARIETAAAKAPAAQPTTMISAPAPQPTGKIGRVKPEAESGGTDADADGDTPEPTGALDAAAKQALSAAKKVIEAALRATQPALAEAAPKAARVVTSALQTVRDDLPAAIAADTKTMIDDIASSAALATQAAPAPATAVQPREAATALTPDHSLDLANEAGWLDRLARDIAQASGNEGTIRFRLHPQTLGHLSVELSQGDHGTSIRLTADTEHARAILADAQPRLAAEARAQGVRIAETLVDLSGSDRHFSGDPRRQDQASQTPLIRTARDAAADADASERPDRTRSDRYA